MQHAYRLSLVGLVGILFVLGNPAAAPVEVRGQQQHKPHFEECAKACNICQRHCDACTQHCAELAAMGKKDHLRTMATCADCATVCAAASRIVSRGGPMTVLICDACFRACDVCAASCEKFTADEYMKSCAQECRRCERECREMIKRLSGK